jgi:DNA repair exonuclease SbcCD ATPase subunit
LSTTPFIRLLPLIHFTSEQKMIWREINWLTGSYLDFQQTRTARENRIRKLEEEIMVEKGLAIKKESTDEYGSNTMKIDVLKGKEDKVKEALEELHEQDAGFKILAAHHARLQKEEKQLLKEAFELTKQHALWQWCENTNGLSYVAAMTFLGYINPQKCTFASKIWAYAGLTPDSKIKHSEKANSNPRLRVDFGSLLQTQLGQMTRTMLNYTY